MPGTMVLATMTAFYLRYMRGVDAVFRSYDFLFSCVAKNGLRLISCQFVPCFWGTNWRSVEMTPRRSSLYLSDATDTDAVFSADYVKRSCVTNNSVSHVVSEFGIVMVAAIVCATRSALEHFVSVVVSCCPNKQVGWFYAIWRIAMMTYEHALWYRSMCKFPRYAVNRFWICVVRSTVFRIAFWIGESDPNTASCWGEKVAHSLNELRKRFVAESYLSSQDASTMAVDVLASKRCCGNAAVATQHVLATGIIA